MINPLNKYFSGFQTSLESLRLLKHKFWPFHCRFLFLVKPETKNEHFSALVSHMDNVVDFVTQKSYRDDCMVHVPIPGFNPWHHLNIYLLVIA